MTDTTAAEIAAAIRETIATGAALDEADFLHGGAKDRVSVLLPHFGRGYQLGYLAGYEARGGELDALREELGAANYFNAARRESEDALTTTIAELESSRDDLRAELTTARAAEVQPTAALDEAAVAEETARVIDCSFKHGRALAFQIAEAICAKFHAAERAE